MPSFSEGTCLNSIWGDFHEVFGGCSVAEHIHLSFWSIDVCCVKGEGRWSSPRNKTWGEGPKGITAPEVRNPTTGPMCWPMHVDIDSSVCVCLCIVVQIEWIVCNMMLIVLIVLLLEWQLVGIQKTYRNESNACIYIYRIYIYSRLDASRPLPPFNHGFRPAEVGMLRGILCLTHGSAFEVQIFWAKFRSLCRV